MSGTNKFEFAGNVATESAARFREWLQEVIEDPIFLDNWAMTGALRGEAYHTENKSNKLHYCSVAADGEIIDQLHEWLKAQKFIYHRSNPND